MRTAAAGLGLALLGALAAAPAQSGDDKVLDSSRILERSPIHYPRLDLCMGTEGTTRVLITIDGQGRPTDVSVSRSSGSRSLDRAAVTSLRDWKFKATGEPFWGYVDVDYELSPSQGGDDEPGDDEPGRCTKAHFSLFGGLVGEMPGYEAGSLEVMVHGFPADADTLEVTVQDMDGQSLQSARLAYEDRGESPDGIPWAVRFKGLSAGAYQVVLIAGDSVRGRQSFRVLENGSVESALPEAPFP